MTILDLCPERIEPEPMSGCWLWVGADNGAGYGKVDKRTYAHRRSFELSHGPLGPDEKACHRCDTPPCVNPEHLFRGTHTANVRDMVAKRRHWCPAREVTHCPKGHAYDERNTHIRPDGARACSACYRERARERRRAAAEVRSC